MENIEMERKLFRDKPERKPRATPLEQTLQNYICSEFDILLNNGWVFAYAGDMNAQRRTWAEAQVAKATGMKAGEPDIRVYLPGGRLILIELKVKAKNSVQKHQKDRHEVMRSLGFEVLIWRFKTTDEACAAARALIAEYSYVDPEFTRAAA
jgi:hypothetical protein